MNEHDCPIKVTRVGGPMMKPDPNAEPAWVSNTVRIQIGSDRRREFLPAVLEATGLEYFPGEKPHLHIESAPIRRVYRVVTGVDLESHGYPEMVFQG